MAGSASIFFGVLFLFMNGLWLLGYKTRGGARPTGGAIWWSLYIIFFLGWAITGCIKRCIPVKMFSEKENAEEV
jgi:hypothetical protein